MRSYNTSNRSNFLLFREWLIAAAFTVLLFSYGNTTLAQQSTVLDTLNKQSHPVTLSQAIQVSLANNTQIRRALLSIKDADQEVRKAWSNVMPNVNASASYTRNLEVPVNFVPEVVLDPQNGDPNTLIPLSFGTDNNWSGGVTATQTIFNGQAFVGISSSELFKTAQAESLRATSQQVVTQTRQAYYGVLIAQERVRLQEAQIERVQKNLADARKQLEQGFVDEYAVMQLEVQLSNLKPQLTQARYDVEEARRNLLDVMGLPVSYPLNVKGDLNSFDIQTAQATQQANKSIKEIDTVTPLKLQADSLLLRQASDYRGDLRLLDVQQKLQNKQIKAQKSKLLPTLSASYNLQYTASQPGSPVFFGTKGESRARSQAFMLNFSLPLFQGFRRSASIQQAKIQLKDLKLLEHQAQQTAEKEITSTKEQIREAYETATARKRARDQARRGYERARLRYSNGLGSQQEVTDAQIQLRQSELNYAQMVFSYLSAKAQYDLALGRVPYVDQPPSELRNDIEN